VSAAVPLRSAPEQLPGAGARRARIVSLVPSLTEACFEVGLGEHVVAVTEWCVHPAEGVRRLPKVGGTKNPDVDRIAQLAPDFVIANHEENTRRAVEALEARGLRVWVTDPRSVAGGVEVFAQIARLSPERERAGACLAEVEAEFAAAKAALGAGAGPRVFCPIWRDPWMAVGADTYASDLLSVCGANNVFADAKRDASERRYPRVELVEIEAAAPEVVLLPDEPYAFGPADVLDLSALDIPAARTSRIHLIDGTWVSWYGPRIAPAIRSLRPLLAPSPT